MALLEQKELAQEFIDRSSPAIKFLFDALSSYFDVIGSLQASIEEIESTKHVLTDLFVSRDQWSPNANHYHAQYMSRVKELEEQKIAIGKTDSEKIEQAFRVMDSTEESMSVLAGSVLQIAKQTLSIRYSAKPKLAASRVLGSQSVVEVIWEGRNHALHWEEVENRSKVGGDA